MCVVTKRNLARKLTVHVVVDFIGHLVERDEHLVHVVPVGEVLAMQFHHFLLRLLHGTHGHLELLLLGAHLRFVDGSEARKVGPVVLPTVGLGVIVLQGRLRAPIIWTLACTEFFDSVCVSEE